MKFHEVSEVFPLMQEDEYSRLREDIKNNGQLEAIWTYRDQIIDGRNRYNACIELGITPRLREWSGTGSLISFVVSLNLHRRHLSESQRGDVGFRITNLKQGQYKTDTAIAVSVSQADASKLLNVSVDTIQRAGKVINEGISDLAEMVQAGTLSVSTASIIATLPKSKQKRLVKRGRDKLIQYASNLTAEKKLKNARSTSEVCFLCNPSIELNEDNIVAFLHATTRRAGRFARFFNSILEEIEESRTADEMRSDYERILQAVDAGYREFAQILNFTKIEKDRLRYEINCLIEGKTLETGIQGGKTDAARGQRKTLYLRSQKTKISEDDGRQQLNDEFDDEGDFFGFKNHFSIDTFGR